MTENLDTGATPDDGAPAPVDTNVGSEPKKYTGDLHGIEEATADLQRDRDEKKKEAPSIERVAKAKQKLGERVAERMGAETVDLDMITWNDKDDKNLAPLKAAKGLAEFRRQKEAGLQEILREEDAAAADDEAWAKTTAEYNAGVEQETQRQAAEEQYQRQQQASEQTRQLSDTEHALRGRLQQYQAAALAEVPELPQLMQLAQNNPGQAQAVWAAFAAQNPGKVARIQQLDSAYRADAAQAELAAVHHHQNQRQAFQEWAKTQDDTFMKAHPELADRRTRFEAMEDVVEYLRDKRGLSEDRLRQLWSTDATFRSAEAQSMIFDAAKAYSMEKRLNEIRPTQPPQPQRPGVSTGRVGQNGSGESLAKIDTAGSQRRQLSAAAEVVMARRRAAAKGRR
jgi:hypothetical protein